MELPDGESSPSPPTLGFGTFQRSRTPSPPALRDRQSPAPAASPLESPALAASPVDSPVLTGFSWQHRLVGSLQPELRQQSRHAMPHVAFGSSTPSPTQSAVLLHEDPNSSVRSAITLPPSVQTTTPQLAASMPSSQPPGQPPRSHPHPPGVPHEHSPESIASNASVTAAAAAPRRRTALLTWGLNSSGQLGFGDFATRSVARHRRLKRPGRGHLHTPHAHDLSATHTCEHACAYTHTYTGRGRLRTPHAHDLSRHITSNAFLPHPAAISCRAVHTHIHVHAASSSCRAVHTRIHVHAASCGQPVDHFESYLTRATYSLACPPACPLAYPPAYPLACPLAYSPTRSLIHSPTNSNGVTE